MSFKQRTMIPRSKWNMLSCEDQIALAKLIKEAKSRMLDIFDEEKESNSNPVAVVNNHKIVFDDEDEGEDMTCNSNPSISAQTPLPSNKTSWQVHMNPIPQDGRFKQTLPHYEEVSVKKSTKNPKKGGYFTWSPTRQQNLMNRLMPTAFSPRLLRRSPQVISRGTTT